MKTDLVRIHHADFDEDIPFWISRTQGLDPLLEVGCGHGRVTLPLVKSGRTVVGIDWDHEALSYLRDSLVKDYPEVTDEVTLELGDILAYQPDRPFGSVIVPCNTYTTFNPDDRVALLTKAIAVLKKGGLLAASLPNPVLMEEIIAELSAQERDWDLDLEASFPHPESGFPVQVSSRMRLGGENLLWDWIYDHMFPDGRVDRSVVTTEHFPASTGVYLSELKEAGFGDIQCLGDYAGSPFSDSSPYLIILCCK